MSSDHEAEIRASVAAHADLGPGYDAAVAEGLVERIGEEIDRRIDARLGHEVPGHRGSAAPAGAQPGVPTPAGAAGAPGTTGAPGTAGVTGGAGVTGAGVTGAATSAGPAGYQPYQGYQGYLGPMLPPGYQLGPPPARPSQVGTRSVANTVTALGSIALGVAATAIVAHGDTAGGQGFIILLIWVAIAVINVAYARRP
jgi:hypothetical protein